MSAGDALSVAWRVLRGEGAAAVVARSLDRLSEWRRARSFVPAGEDWRPREAVPVLNLLAMPPAARLGGVPIQLLARLAVETCSRPVALLATARDGWRLEVEAGEQRRAVALPGPKPEPDAVYDPAFAAVVERARAIMGATILHVEGLAGVPLGALASLRPPLPRLILSLHDFAAFCPRPHLVERPAFAFCGFCRDLERCERCLGHDWPRDGEWQAWRRGVGAELLAAADALVFPSSFLATAHQELFPVLASKRLLVVPPAPFPSAAPSAARARRGPADGRRRFHVAFAGSVQLHKGAGVLAEVVERLAADGIAPRWTVYGGGDPGQLARLRRLVRVTGYYRAGTLARRLRHDAVDLVVLPSTVPESHSLTLDECGEAGVPVVAFDLGAPAERLRRGGGLLVPLSAGAAGLAAAVAELVSGRRDFPVGGPAAARPEDAAAALAALYDELLAGPLTPRPGA